MRLALSTAAAPDLALPKLIDACARRGLAALELIADDSHGIGPELEYREVLEIAAETAARGIAFAAYHARGLWEAAAPETVRLAFGLDTPVIVTLDESDDDGAILNAARRYSAVGAHLLIEHGTSVAEVEWLSKLASRIDAESVGLAWEVDPATGTLDESAAQIIDTAGPLLRHIRLRGGGPEAAQGEGLGIGSLMGRLTLARYGGNIAIAPSTPRYRLAWSAWLGRGRGGWGCGSKSSDDSLVNLSQ